MNRTKLYIVLILCASCLFSCSLMKIKPVIGTTTVTEEISIVESDVTVNEIPKKRNHTYYKIVDSVILIGVFILLCCAVEATHRRKE